MRTPARIPRFLNLSSMVVMLQVWGLPHINYMDLGRRIEKDRSKIEKYWVQNPDLRFTQVLIALGYVENSPGTWFYDTEAEILMKQGYTAAESHLWGINYDKNQKRLPKTIWKPISELDTDHIEAILEGGWVRKGNPYYNFFKEELRYRSEDEEDWADEDEEWDDDED